MLEDDEISSGEKSADVKENFHDGCSYCISPPPTPTYGMLLLKHWGTYVGDIIRFD